MSGVKAWRRSCHGMSWQCGFVSLWPQLASGSVTLCLHSPGRKPPSPSWDPLRGQVSHATAFPPASKWISSLQACLRRSAEAFFLALSKSHILCGFREFLWPVSKTEKLASHLATEFFASKWLGHVKSSIVIWQIKLMYFRYRQNWVESQFRDYITEKLRNLFKFTESWVLNFKLGQLNCSSCLKVIHNKV